MKLIKKKYSIPQNYFKLKGSEVGINAFQPVLTHLKEY